MMLMTMMIDDSTMPMYRDSDTRLHCIAYHEINNIPRNIISKVAQMHVGVSSHDMAQFSRTS